MSTACSSTPPCWRAISPREPGACPPRRWLATLSLNRPDRGNALGPELVEALAEAFDRAVAHGARLIVLRGEGRHFCTGFDLTDLESLSDGDLLLRVVRIEALLQCIHAAPVTTLAVATGRTFGAGADLFAACDRRIATL